MARGRASHLYWRRLLSHGLRPCLALVLEEAAKPWPMAVANTQTHNVRSTELAHEKATHSPCTVPAICGNQRKLDGNTWP